MKAVCEYNEPEYVTRDYGRNKVLRFVMNCKKVSVGVLVMLFLWSNEVKAVPFVQIDGGLSYMHEKTVMKNSVISVLKVYGCWLGVCVIVIAIYGILQSIKIGKCFARILRNAIFHPTARNVSIDSERRTV